MTDDVTARLAAIEQRANAATEGPWWAWDRGVGWHIAVREGERDEVGLPHLLPEGFRTDIDRREDAEFIAHAREDVPWLIEQLHAERDQSAVLLAHVLDIDAHATPFGDIPDEPGWVGLYLLTAGALHRALGTIGHTAPSCEAEAAIARIRAVIDGIDQRHHGRHDDERDSECFACWRADLLRALDGEVDR